VKVLWAIVAAALVAGAAAGAYAWHAAQQKREQQRAIAALVDNGTAQIKAALSIDAAHSSARGSPGAAELLEAQAALDQLRAMDSARQRGFAEAAERYLISAHSIVRARGEAARLSREAAADRQALAAQLASRRNDAWFAATMAIKKRVEQEHFDLAHAYQGLDEVLGALGDDTQALAQYVPANTLVNQAQRDDARRQAKDDAARAAAELERSRRSIEPQ